MKLIAAAERIAEQIPDSHDYRDEREFCWSTIGHTAIALRDHPRFRLAIDRLGVSGYGGELRIAALRIKDLRSELLDHFVGLLQSWELVLYPSELSEVLREVLREFGFARAVELAKRLSETRDRIVCLLDLSAATPDQVWHRGMLAEAREMAAVADIDRDFELRKVGNAYMDVGMLSEAREIGAQIASTALRLDYLERLSKEFESREHIHDADQVGAERIDLEASDPEIEAESSILAKAQELLNYDLPGMPPRDDAVMREIVGKVAACDFAGAIELARDRFPTRACPALLGITDPARSDFLLFQLDAVDRYRRNDLKVEYLCALELEFFRRNQEVPAKVLERAGLASFVALENAAAPAFISRDASEMDFEEFVRFLFDRPLAVTAEEERFMQRDVRESSLWVRNPAQLLSLSTRLFTEFGQYAAAYTPEQVDQAMWGLNWFPMNLNDYLNSAWAGRWAIPEEAITDCIRAAYHVFADYVAGRDLPESVLYFHMWWDLTWHEPSPAVLDAVLEVQERVLAIDDDRCRNAALHGLNHLPHEGVPAVIDRFLAATEGKLSAEMVAYAAACRAHEAM